MTLLTPLADIHTAISHLRALMMRPTYVLHSLIIKHLQPCVLHERAQVSICQAWWLARHGGLRNCEFSEVPQILWGSQIVGGNWEDIRTKPSEVGIVVVEGVQDRAIRVCDIASHIVPFIIYHISVWSLLIRRVQIKPGSHLHFPCPLDLWVHEHIAVYTHRHGTESALTMDINFT